MAWCTSPTPGARNASSTSSWIWRSSRRALCVRAAGRRSSPLPGTKCWRRPQFHPPPTPHFSDDARLAVKLGRLLLLLLLPALAAAQTPDVAVRLYHYWPPPAHRADSPRGVCRRGDGRGGGRLRARRNAEGHGCGRALLCRALSGTP